ncbi:General transcription factor 3C polypeptide 3 [Portunus trituberculatus]|uniref:General transcription factor 3C polypeptide 3 n=1 Tax=Portunus trituberculatus TaxID=210409 RepID=A0A5B7IWE4_PORTR|nr:General transcription factor 3C polypeptide 3 [Portunus trituberculatus]
MNLRHSLFRFQLKRKGGKEKRRRRRLPAALQGLMGEANLRFARGEFDEAIKMCMEVIRQFSHSPEPYQQYLADPHQVEASCFLGLVKPPLTLPTWSMLCPSP